jgi:hypothetical protein
MISDKMRPNFAVLLALAWALVAIWLLTQFWTSAATAISDPDDAMRLAQVREFLAGKGWFDLAEPRVNPPYGYLTHWSRLIDLGLAGLFMLARGFVEPVTAERVMIEVWPVLWLLPAMGGVAAIAWRCGGREAALVALVIAVFGLPAFQHFQPGRIDHHNVQITLAVLAVAAAVWSDRVAWASLAAGLLSVLALAVGLESLPWIVLAGAIIALRFVIDADGARAMRAYGLVLAAGALAAFFVNTNPTQWFNPVCDALAINLALAVVVGGASLAVVAGTCATSRTTRIAGVAVCALVALGIFAGLEPRCLGGPFAMIDPVVRPIWLAEVREMEPLARLFGIAPVMGTWVAAFPAFAVAAALWLLTDRNARTFGTLTAIAALAIAVVLTLSMVKAYSYAMWFAMPVVAVAASSLFAQFEVWRPLRWLAAIVVTPITISAGAISFAQASNQQITPPSKRDACFKIDAYESLNKIPAGLIAADVDLGPTLLAFTNHAVLAAPYHRISYGIVIANRILSSPPEQARKALAESRANYVVLCGSAKPTGLENAAPANGLWTKLVAGEVPAWLERVALSETSPFTVYRVKP